MIYHYESRRFTKAGNDEWKCRGVVYHYSNLDGEEVIDYESHNYDTSHEAIDDAVEWMEENDIDGEMS